MGPSSRENAPLNDTNNENVFLDDGEDDNNPPIPMEGSGVGMISTDTTTTTSITGSISRTVVNTTSRSYRFRQKNEDVIIAVLYKIFSLAGVSNTDQTFTVNVGEEMAIYISQSEYDKFRQDPISFRPDYLPETFPYNGTEWEWDDHLLTSEGCGFYMRQLSSDQNHTNPDFGNRCFVWRQRQGKITFNEPFELQRFPFDVQTLTMTFQFHTYKQTPSATTKDNDDDITFKIHPLYGGAAYSYGFVEPQGEFQVLRKHTHFTVKGTPYMGDSQVHCTFVIRRQWIFYFWKVIFVLSVISLTAIVALLVFDSFLDQVGHLSTILLTDVAYLYIVSTYIPTLHYLTWMDWYVLWNILFVFGIFVEVSIIELIGGSDEANRSVGGTNLTVGDFMLLVSTLTWVGINGLFVLWAIRARHLEAQKITTTFGNE